jgi:hypothetical protein
LELQLLLKKPFVFKKIYLKVVSLEESIALVNFMHNLAQLEKGFFVVQQFNVVLHGSHFSRVDSLIKPSRQRHIERWIEVVSEKRNADMGCIAVKEICVITIFRFLLKEYRTHKA